jgi:hypothetical protein
MNLCLRRSVALAPALFVLAACGMPPSEAVRPVPERLAPEPVAPPADLPVASAVVPAAELVVSQDLCESDADCMPAACCHASACMSRDRGRPCAMMCTQVCQPGTIDCGGGCLCYKGHCAAQLGNGGN